MRRADRLFQIIQVLRRRRGLTTAQHLAGELEVSVRTIYRDIADLIGSGVPIEGEPGLGYLLRGGFDLPPLMFTAEEVEAIVLGARIVQSWSDPALARAAADVLDKIGRVVPERLAALIAESGLVAPQDHWRETVFVDLADLRRAVRTRRRLSLDYRDQNGNATQRTVRPLALAFYGPIWLLLSWCELRQDFRSFRVDRISRMAMLEQFPPQPVGQRLEDFLARRPAQAKVTIAA